MREELAEYRSVFREATGEEPPPPLVAGWTYVDKSADKAETMARQYIGGYWDSIIKHYEFDQDHLKKHQGIRVSTARCTTGYTHQVEWNV